MGSRVGVQKAAAKRIGISIEEYLARIAKGFKWCYRCKLWKQKSEFPSDKSRGDNLASTCADCRHVKVRRKHKHKAPSGKVQSQASNAVNYEIKCGKLAKPTNLPCYDCGEPAREYHHYLGYRKSHWLNVIPLCNKCHSRRHWE